jgi:hypothetical protein
VTVEYARGSTGLLLVDPCNDFLGEGGKAHMHAAHELTGPFYASAILTTAEVSAALPQG